MTSWSSDIIDALSAYDGFSSDPDIITAYNHDTMLTGHPDAVWRPRDARDVADMIRYAGAHKIPITPVAARTSMTGASAANSGIVLSTEKWDRILDIDRQKREITTDPGVVLATLKSAVEGQGLYYPPTPTSFREALVGGTVATNATGDNTYKYGSTRCYVKEIQAISGNGDPITLSRRNPIKETKNKAGYFLSGDPIDQWIGSEGTLGVITHITLSLLDGVPSSLAVIAPFSSNEAALTFIHHIATTHSLKPAALEYIDHNALAIMATHPTFPTELASAGALVVAQQEYIDSPDIEMNQWLAELEHHYTLAGSSDLANHIHIIQSPTQWTSLRDWRHHIPMIVNEMGHRLELAGGGKVGSDFWCPVRHMPEMMKTIYHSCEASGIDYLAFAHLGNGHPHVNLLAKNADEKVRAEALLLQFCQLAVQLGGGVAGEHGLGKIKRHLLAIQHSPAIIASMRAIKNHFDPHGIMSPGNIF